jgi:uncharacterized protein (DUF427 family)
MAGHRIEKSPKWVRGYVGDRLVVDSRAVQLVWEHERYPQWYVPEADVRDSGLPITTIEDLPGHVKVAWDGVDRWFEEEVEVFVHPRDPYKRIDALASSRHVLVRADGEILAESMRPVILYETGLRPRYYLPIEDVRSDLLRPSDASTACPYKGVARYWSARVGDRTWDDIAWSYPDPLPESEPIRDLVCFYDERIDVEVDSKPIV